MEVVQHRRPECLPEDGRRRWTIVTTVTTTTIGSGAAIAGATTTATVVHLRSRGADSCSVGQKTNVVCLFVMESDVND